MADSKLSAVEMLCSRLFENSSRRVRSLQQLLSLLPKLASEEAGALCRLFQNRESLRAGWRET